MPLNLPEFKDRLKLSYVPMRRTNEDNGVTSSCSGCLVRYKDKRFLLTAAHAVGNHGIWAVEVEFDPNRGGTCLYRLGAMGFLRAGNIQTGKVHDVDFAYKQVPDDLQPKYQKVSPRGEIQHQAARLDVNSELQTQPKSDLVFGFCGQANVQKVGTWGLSADQPMEVGMRFLTTGGDMHVFKLSHDHPGHDYYRGCSGAPILDSNGDLVALVIAGRIEDSLIFGIDLQRYRAALEVELLQQQQQQQQD